MKIEMKHLIIFILIMPTFFTAATSAQKKYDISIQWKVAAKLPAATGNKKVLGFAGVVNGVNKNVLLVAGGANFPNGMPWNGGEKYYSDKIYVLQKESNKFIWNNKIKGILPEPIAYCGNTSTNMGIVYVGGENKNGISNKAFIINWDGSKNKIDVRPLPKLPLALTNVAVTHIGNVVYAAGGDDAYLSSKSFFSIDLNEKNPQWKKLPDLPIALANATAVVQKENTGQSIYLIGGRSKTASGVSDLHNTTFAFDPIKNVWKKCADISDGKNSTNLSAAAGVALGNNYILVAGGDNGIIFHKIEILICKIAQAKISEEKAKLTAEKNNLNIYHEGFDESLLLYNTNTDTWTKIGELPFPAQVTTTAAKWGNDIVISNGEIKPGIRTPNIMIGKVVLQKEPEK